MSTKSNLYHRRFPEIVLAASGSTTLSQLNYRDEDDAVSRYFVTYRSHVTGVVSLIKPLLRFIAVASVQGRSGIWGVVGCFKENRWRMKNLII